MKRTSKQLRRARVLHSLRVLHAHYVCVYHAPCASRLRAIHACKLALFVNPNVYRAHMRKHNEHDSARVATFEIDRRGTWSHARYESDRATMQSYLLQNR